MRYCEVNVYNDVYFIDFNTDCWVRVIVENAPSYERGNGREPQWFSIKSLHLIRSTGDPDHLNITLSQDYFFCPEEQFNGDNDVDFMEWLEIHEEEFLERIKAIVLEKLQATTLMLSQLSLLSNDFWNRGYYEEPDNE